MTTVEIFPFLKPVHNLLFGSPTAWILIAVAARLLYVVSIGLLLRHENMTHYRAQKYGYDRAFKHFKHFAGSVMKLDSICLFLLPMATAGSLPFPAIYAISGGLGLVALGIGIKLWATYTLTFDGFYFRDTFVPAKNKRIVLDRGAVGPYRYFKNPMYGIGNAHIIGWALVWQSVPGIIVGIGAIIVLFVFYYIVEKPHVETIEKTA